ncbi:small basic family protein [Fonticella tunisiensis]|uniref:Small basic protein n=1 Tax=Fonticella tunisiensis TaxID=1096341 RepID=A0A4R7KSQ5_9CLOT|nr:small basic family protein [Fonticella tunisiensis]TDT61855.1 small basic protein [Fonticella tunisiensis]
MIPLIGLLIGIFIGLFLKVNIPNIFAPYVPVAILAALDSVFGGVRAGIEKKFDTEIFVSGFFGNIILAAGLTYLGDRLDVPIYLAAVVVFGSRLFNNFAIIRRLLIERGREKIKHKEEQL